MPENQSSDILLEWLLAELRERLKQALEPMVGEEVEVLPAPGPAAETGLGEGALWWRQPFRLPGDGAAYAGAPAECWEAIGKKALQAAGIDEAEASDIQATYQEILSQAFSGLASALSGRLGREVTCAPGEGIAVPPADVEFRRVELAPASGGRWLVLAGFSRPLFEALEPAPKAPPQTAVAARPVPENSPAAGSQTIDLLLEVELPVSISFGRSQLPLKDVLKLTTGSIVELNRTVSEPVEVIVNNCVIARGEVVVVEGNYGVRIQQIVSRQERLRSLY